MSKRRVLLNGIVLVAMVFNISPMSAMASPPTSPPLAPMPRAAMALPGYGDAIQIEARNNATSTLPSGYTIRLSLDTASLISQGRMQADCDDLRVTFMSGAETELNRLVEGCNSSSTAVAFRTQADIALGGTDVNYYLYFGNAAAANPPSDPAQVYAFYDDFQDGSADGWNAAKGTWNVVNDNGNYVYRYTEGGAAWALSYVPLSGVSNLDYLTRLRASANTNWIGLAFRIQDQNNFLTFYESKDVGQFKFARVVNDGHQVVLYPSFAMAAGAWYRLRLQAIGNQVRARIWQDGTTEPTSWAINTTESMYQSETNIGLTLYNHTAVADWDDVQVSRLADAEPTITLHWGNAPWWNTGWGYRSRLTTTNNSSTETLPVRYSASLTLDTAARIGAGQMSDTCGDVRIVSFSGIANTELDRIVQDCNTDHTRVWFALQRPIGPSGLDDNYYLYYGNPSAGAPPANGMNVFLFFEDWEQTATHWTNAGGLDSGNTGTLGTSVISSDEWVSSSHSQQFLQKISGGDAFSGYIPVTPGTGYAIGVWAKSATGAYAPVGLDPYDAGYTKGNEVWLWTNEWTIPSQWAYRSGRFTTNASTVFLKIKSEWWNQGPGTEPVYMDNLSLRYALATEPTVASGDEETILSLPVIVTVHDTGPVQIGTAVNVTAVVSSTEGTIDAVTLRLQSPVSTDVPMSLTSGDAYTGTWQGSYTPTQGGVYTYRVLAHASTGHSKLSSAHTFNATDTQPPQITLTSLTDPILVRNTQTLTVTVTDNGAVSSVGVDLGGVIHPMAQQGSQYSYSWRVLTVGTITYTVIATDTVGNRATLNGSFQSLAREADVCTWLSCKSSAASWSNDDGNSSCRAELEAAGIRGTYYYNGTGTQAWFADYSAAGHEIGSHSVGHPCDTPACTPNCTPAALWQIPFTQQEVNTYRQDQIEPNLVAIEGGTGKPVVSMAWPCGCADARRMTAASSYFLGVRGYYDYIAQLAWVQDVNEPTPVEFMNLNSANSYDQTFIDRAYNEGKWAIITSHGSCAGIDYMGSRRNAMWVAPVGDVLKYIRVRDAAQFTNYSRAGRTISFDVQHNLGALQRQRVDSTYMSPIVLDNAVSLKAHLLDADNVLSVQVNGASVSFAVQALEGTRYVVFDSALDSARHVVITLAGAAPTLGAISDNSPVEFGGAAYVTATVTISEGTVQTVTLRVLSPQAADVAMSLVAGTTDSYAASFSPSQVTTTTYQVLASNSEGTSSLSAVRSLVVRDTTLPAWQSQAQAHDAILATGVNTLTAQGLDLGGLKWAILSTNESGAWQEFNWPASDWWDHAWAHRRAINVAEAAGLARTNETVDLSLSAADMPGLTDCAAELRVADGNRVEIPSQVVDVQSDGGNLTCRLLFQASVNANSNRIYYVYYDNPSATPPVYTTDLTRSSAGGVVTVHNSFFDLDLDADSGVVSRVRLPGGSNTDLPLSPETSVYWGWHQVCSSADGGNITGKNSLCVGGGAAATGLVPVLSLDGPVAQQVTFSSVRGTAIYTMSFRFYANAPYYQYSLTRAGTSATVMNNFWYANGNFSRLSAGSGGTPATAYNTYGNSTDQVRMASFATVDAGSIDGMDNDGTELGATDYRSPTASGLALYVATGADQPAAQDVLARIATPVAAALGTVEAAPQGQYGSPMDLHGATNWTPTSFTWQNGTLPNGTQVGWRVKYCDEADNCSTSGVMTFAVYNVAADLALEKLDSPDPVTVGRPLTYRITVTNYGASTATNVTLTDTLPSGVTFGSATPGQGTCSGTSQVICNLGDLSIGANAVVTILVTPTVTGTLSNTASVSADTIDLNSANNSAQAQTLSVSWACPCSLWNDSAIPAIQSSTDILPFELGVKFRSEVPGYVTGLRFYKGSLNTGVHVGHLWAADGTLLAEAIFTDESSSGWQEVILPAPIQIEADTIYIASYNTRVGHFAVDDEYFNSPRLYSPLYAPANGEVGPNGVYQDNGGFPNQSVGPRNYWVDVVFNTSPGADTTPPQVTAISPASGATGVNVYADITARFSEAMISTTVSASTIELRDASNSLVPAAVTYNAASRTATLNPSSALPASSTYTATVKGGETGVRDLAGNALATDTVWSFTTGAPPPEEGLGGPILVVASDSNPFTRYYAEILRTEGLNTFTVTDIALVTPTSLTAYTVVLLGESPLNSGQVTMLSDWVNGGGRLIAMRPDKQLAGLLGLTDAASTLANAYLLVDTSSGPGTGIVNQTMQYHSTADLYTLNGATSLATLYSGAMTATTYPAVTRHNVGTLGGQAVAFTYDLARSVVYTRQGNPLWAGQNRDPNDPSVSRIIAHDMFFGAASYDPQPDWVDFSKIQIPQADEQQRLLANLVLTLSWDKMPLPRFWYFPRGEKAVVIMTGDDHGNGGTAGRFDHYKAVGPAGCSVADWECVRSSSYIWTNANLTNQQAVSYTADGFELGYHINTGCVDWTPASLAANYADQLNAWYAAYPGLPPQLSVRTHCVNWTDWATQPKVQISHGIRMDTNYYYYPPHWVQERPGLFTGSGMPMRFADTDGTMINVFQAVTQMTDESSGSGYGTFNPIHINTLLDNAVGPQGYYGAFAANMHTDGIDHAGSEAILAAAMSRHVPIVSAQQMIEWLDGRNSSTFRSLSWNGSTLSFAITVGADARGLRGMLPSQSTAGQLVELTRNASPIMFTLQTIKGIEYAFFAADAGDYQARYEPDLAPPAITNVHASPYTGGVVTLTWTTDEPSSSRIDYGDTPDSLALSATDAALVTTHAIMLTGLTPNTTYYYRVTSADASGNAATYPAAGESLSFTMPSRVLVETTVTDYGAGTPGGCYVAGIGDGAVILAPTVGTEFSGTTLPSDWFVAQYPSGGSGGTAVVGGGVLTVDGAMAGTNAVYGPGRALEFVATFTQGWYQHVGFSVDYANPIWAIFSTEGTGNFILARTSSGTASSETYLSSSLIGTPHHYRIEWNADSAVYYVDGVEVANHAIAVTTNMRPIIAEYAVGARTLTADWLRMQPYASSCAFTSQVLDAVGTATWGLATWTADVPASTGLTISMRMGDTPIPDGTWTAFSVLPSSGAPINGTSRYIQYRAEMATSVPSQTPVLHDLTIGYNFIPDTTPPTIVSRSPAPGAIGVPFDTDVVVQFSEPMSSTTFTPETVNLRAFGGSSDVPAIVSYSGLTATLHPINPLGVATLYQATVAGTVTDLNGNPLGSDAIWTFTTLPTARYRDTTIFDFSAGEPGACYLAQTTDGEVMLSPAVGTEFSGSLLPADWFSSIYGPGLGTNAVSGGALTVDGTSVGTSALYGPGRVLEFVATFTQGWYQHAGFGVDYANPPWAMISTEATGNVLLVRTNSGGPSLETPLSSSLFDTPHRYRIEWYADHVAYYVDGQQVANHLVAVTADLRPLIAEYGWGAQVLTVDWLHMSPYASPCAFTSRTFDGGLPVSWVGVSTLVGGPTGGTVSLETRTSPDGNAWSGWASVGGDGSPTSPEGRYLQYRANLGATDPSASPIVEEVNITFTIQADLEVTQTAAPDPVMAGSPLTYQITVTNHGQSAATGVMLTDTLPFAVILASATSSAGPGACSGTSLIICNLGNLANGGTATVTIVVTPTAVGTATNTAGVTSSNVDQVTANNTAEASSAVSPLQFALNTGWNLVSLPLLQPATFITEALSSIAGHYDLVYAYNGCSGAWQKYDASAPPYANDLASLDSTQGLWVHVSSPVALAVQGSAPTSSAIPLCTGWNLVGYPSLTVRPLPEALSGVPFDLMYAYDAFDADPWQLYDVNMPFSNDLTEVRATRGYWIRTSGNSLWQVER